MGKLRIGILISGTGTNMNAIIKACEEKKIDGEVVCVGSDNREAKGLGTARIKGIPIFTVDYKAQIKKFDENPDSIMKKLGQYEFPVFDALVKQKSIVKKNKSMEEAIRFLYCKIAAEAELLSQLELFNPDLLVLAGYMKILTAYFIDRFDSNPIIPRIMNIHPALLPAFPGVDGYGDTFRYGCKVGGCTVQFVDYGEDTGPIIGQRSFSINPGDTLEDIKKRGLELEWELYPNCIQLFAEDRMIIVQEEGRKIVVIE
jgi:phosphoribosylglycinamide formyltransferase-1